VNKKRLIEVSLPLAEISEQSAREKSIRHGHISTLHIWWARRPLAAMRAAIFASLVPAPDSDEERQRLERLIATIVDWDQVRGGNSEAIKQAHELIKQAFPDRPPRLLDPFMGGGSTGLEALRLGCETYAMELNPVAHVLELCTLVYPQKYGQPEKRKVQHGAMEVEQEANPLAEDVRKWAEWVLARVAQEIGDLYENPVGDETIVAYFWARTVKCSNPSCQAVVPLVRSWWLAKKGKRQIAIKPELDHVAKQISFEVINFGSASQEAFDPSDGTSSGGNAKCPFCNQVSDVEYVRGEGEAGRIGQMPLAVIYRQTGSTKRYRKITEQDKSMYQAAVDQLSAVEDTIPNEPLPLVGTLGFRVQRYGLTRWGDLFNSRQVLALLCFSRQVDAAYQAMLEDGIEEDYAKALATYLGLLVDRLASYNSTLCYWVIDGEFIGQTFSQGNSLPMSWDHVEVSPFSGATGDWTGAIDWVTRVIEHATMASGQSAIVSQGTATRLPYSEGYFDSVVTDPPYYAHFAYADLSDFFYVWLKRSIGFLYPDLFRTPLTPKTAEIIQEPARHKNDEGEAKSFYEREMTRAFTDACRVLRPEGIFVIVFAHKSTAAWETLLNSLLGAGLVVTASWPLHTERPGRRRAYESAALASSIFIICRVRTAEAEGYLDDVRQELSITIRERLDFFWAQGIRGADFFISAIGPAVSVFGRYWKVYRLDGSEVGVGELLDLVQAMVSEYALDRILNGGATEMRTVDASTRYYILHRWAYAGATIPFDDAMRLAMALGADVSALMERRGILKQSGETVVLLGPRERGGLEGLGLADKAGHMATVIDVLHRATRLWEQGDRETLASFLAEAACGREDQVRLVAQTLVNILPVDDLERRLLEGFLAGRDTLPDMPRQERLL
jgi:adenine-specific DNA methylase